MRYLADRRAGLLVVVVAVAVAAPSVNYQTWDGLPLDSLAEALAFVVLAPFAVSSRLRSALAALLCRLHPAAVGAAILLAGVVIALKVVLLASGGYDGFRACYASPLAPPTGMPCERSYANLFDRYDGATRIDKSINFGSRLGSAAAPSLSGSSWDLSFFNDVRFNTFRGDKPDEAARDRLPLSASWVGEIDLAPGAAVVVSYVGQGTVEVGPSVRVLPPAYRRVRSVTVSGRPGHTLFRLRYTFDPNSTSGPYATLRLTTRSRDGLAVRSQLLHSVSPSGAWQVAALATDISLAALLFILGGTSFYLIGLRGTVLLVIIGVIGRLLVHFGHFGPSIEGVVLALAVTVLILARPRHAWLLAWYIVVLVCALHPVVTSASIGEVVYRTAGNDWIGYESEARSMLTGSLRGGQSIFNYDQPGWRYILFLERCFFGDGDVLRSVFAFVSVNMAAIALALWMGRLTRSIWRRVAIAALAALVIAVLHSGVREFLDISASESPNWALIPLLIAIPFLRPSARWPWVVGPPAIALMAIVRPNHVFAALLLLGVVVASAPAFRRRALFVGLSLFVLVGLLPSIHDAVYGHVLHLPLTNGTSTQAGSSLSLPPHRLIHVFSDPAVRRELRLHAEEILDVIQPPGGGYSAPLAMVLHCLLLAWLATVAVVLRRRHSVRRSLIILMFLPVAYLLPHLVYTVLFYYPRHIIAGYLAMGCVAMGGIAVVGGRAHSPKRSRSAIGPPSASSAGAEPTSPKSTDATRSPV